MAEKKEKNKKRKLHDRILGDEWADWSGENEEMVLAARSLFILFSLLVSAFVSVILLFSWWMIAPRLHMLYAPLDTIVLILLLIGLCGGIAWIILLAFALLLQKPFGPFTGFAVKYINRILPWTIRWGQRFGISRDKMGSSFIKVSNDIAWSIIRRVQSFQNILILLPRCLKKEFIVDIKKIAQMLDIQVSIVAGGEAARKAIVENRPDVIVAIACERDLMSGIQDVSTRIPVIAVPNRRPYGPCKDTEIGMEEMKRILINLTGKRRQNNQTIAVHSS